MEVSIIKEESNKISIWSGGKTKEIYIYPKDGSYAKRDFIFRISSAIIEVEQSQFTELNGIKRFITTLDKEITLIHNGKEKNYLKPYDVYEFSGSINTESIGIAEDFNLMVKEGIDSEMKCIEIDKSYIECVEKDERVIIYAPIEGLNIIIKDEEYLIKKGEALLMEHNNKEAVLEINSGIKHRSKAIICKIQI